MTRFVFFFPDGRIVEKNEAVPVDLVLGVLAWVDRCAWYCWTSEGWEVQALASVPVEHRTYILLNP